MPDRLSPVSDDVFEDDTLSVPRTSSRINSDMSGMSWEEVGGAADREVPSDPRYQQHQHKKTGSIATKTGTIATKIRTAMRKGSQSQSSVTSSSLSPSTSPRQIAAAFSRRGSQSSNANSQISRSHSFTRPDQAAKHKPSMGSLSPPLQPESSANSILLQHQLAGEPALISFLPRADPSDPRIHSSKLSPFPGITQMEERRKAMADHLGEPPKLIHQVSDSAVPSSQRVGPAMVGSDSIYSLPPTMMQTDDSRRSSADSAGRRGWLAKAFGQATSPRSSASVSRKSSTTELRGLAETRSGRKVSVDGKPSFAVAMVDADPFAAPALPLLHKHRSTSPSVSVVPEVSEEGSRYTRFTARAEPSPRASVLLEADEDKEVDDHAALHPRSMEVLNRMDHVLAMTPDDPARPEILDDPPRKLLLATQVLQVVNVNVGTQTRLRGRIWLELITFRP
jgi:hypothetical protein